MPSYYNARTVCLSVCLFVCWWPVFGQTARPIRTKLSGCVPLGSGKDTNTSDPEYTMPKLGFRVKSGMY